MACSKQSKLTFPSSGSGDGHALSVNLGSMGVWASQRRLCLAANLLLLARQEAAKLGVSDGYTERRTKVGEYSRWLSSASFICHKNTSLHFTIYCNLPYFQNYLSKCHCVNLVMLPTCCSMS